MYRLIFVLVAIFAISVGFEIDLNKEYEKAEADLVLKDKERMLSGATSKRFLRKKENRITLDMARRNNLYRALNENLKNAGLKDELARDLANEALSRGRRKPGSAGGQGDLTPPITIIEDSCDAEATVTCDSSYKYRSIEGTCNNLEQTGFEGSAGMAFTRYAVVADNMDPIYNMTFYLSKVASGRQGGGGKDGKGGNDGGSGGSGSCNGDQDGCMVRPNLPGARLVSSTVHTATDVPSTRATHFTTQFGQFLDHDITLTPEEHVEHCCTDNANDESCLTINVSQDEFYSSAGTSCLEFTRSVSHCEGTSSERREQTNGITAFVDGSNIYGTDSTTAELLRTLSGGELKVSARTTGDLLPEIDGFFTAGDVRAREMPGLSISHTIWLREHNRIAKILQESMTDDQEIYDAARRIVVAEWQNVVYGQYMTEVLGNDDLKPKAEGSDYKWSTDPQMTNEFATAAFRYGHSMIQPTIRMLEVDNPDNEIGSYNLRDVFFEDDFYVNNFDNILMGLINLPAQTNDAEVGEDLTNHLFANVLGVGTDLVARNLQRGRDHGLPGFCCYYKKLQNDDFDCTQGWDRRYNGIPENVWERMQEVYNCPSDIDLFTGGIAQQPDDNSHLGKVFFGMVQDQFARTKEGDRFFFTHTGSNINGVGFTKGARETLVARTMSGIICDNSAITKVPDNVFNLDSTTIDCSSTAKIDASNIDELLKFNLS